MERALYRAPTGGRRYSAIRGRHILRVYDGREHADLGAVSLATCQSVWAA